MSITSRHSIQGSSGLLHGRIITENTSLSALVQHNSDGVTYRPAVSHFVSVGSTVLDVVPSNLTVSPHASSNICNDVQYVVVSNSSHSHYNTDFKPLSNGHDKSAKEAVVKPSLTAVAKDTEIIGDTQVEGSKSSAQGDRLKQTQSSDHLDPLADREQGPDKIELHRSDLADDLTVPFPFDTQAHHVIDRSKPPSPPIQTTPPPVKEPATSLHSSSNIYTVANSEIHRAQSKQQAADRQYSNLKSRQSYLQGEVRFDAASTVPISHKSQEGQFIKDRTPTPYAHSPEREELPLTPPQWDSPKEKSQVSKSSSAKQGLPPQHPPLDTLHNTPKPGSHTFRGGEDTQSVKRVYVESPSFTKEEEDEYRFVSSRLEDTEEKNQTTQRDMEHKGRGYGGDDNTNESTVGRSIKIESTHEKRKMGSDYDRKRHDKDRYEDRNIEQTDDMEDNKYYDRYKDKSNEMNVYSVNKDKDKAKGRDSIESYERGEKYKQPGDDRQEKYNQLREQRDEFKRENKHSNESELRNVYQKQNTEIIDQQDLKKEAEYQKDLKKRIDRQKIKDSERLIVRNSFDKDNEFARDSLEYVEDREERGRDDFEYSNYDQQQDWENPPQNPYQDGQYYPDGGYAKQDSKPDFYDPDDVAKMEIVNPIAPKYDFVEGNKHDYGMHPQKSYRAIEHKKKEEEEKLDHIFITPKVSKPKRKDNKQAQSAQPEHLGYQVPDQFAKGFKPSSAEELWSKRAAILTVQKGSAQGSKPGKGSTNKAARWNTNPQVKHSHKFEPPAPLPNQGQVFQPMNSYQGGGVLEASGYPQIHGGYITPPRHLQPLENKPAPPVSTELIPTAVQMSPYRRHMELKPITQEITTEDGQRISVDINLRLISPPPGQVGSPGQQQLALVPVQETLGQSGEGRGYGVPYQIQDMYGNYDGYSGGYEQNASAGIQYTDDYQAGTQPLGLEGRYKDVNNPLNAEELELADPTGYSKRFQTGSMSFKADSMEMKDLEEGYAALYHKMKSKDPSEHPWYKIYNLSDYKKMQREVRLNRGTLGPDLDTESYKDKMEKRHKQFEYARMVMEKNRMELGTKKPPKFPRTPDKLGEEGVKRKAALEYAKNVPKPTVKPRPNQYNSYEVAAQMTSGTMQDKRGSPRLTKSSSPSTQTLDVIDIRTLEQRHLQERRNTEKMRQNMDSVLSQKAH